MKKYFIAIIVILNILSNQACFSEVSEIDMQINSLYAANRLDDTFNLILGIDQDKRSAMQWLIMGNIMSDYDRTEDADFMYNAAIKADPKFYKAYYNLGNLYLGSDKPNMAIDNYKLALKYNKEFAPAYYNLGCAYIKIGELKKAKSAFQNAIYYKPTVADYHYNLAYVNKVLGKNKDAQLYLDYYNKIQNNN